MTRISPGTVVRINSTRGSEKLYNIHHNRTGVVIDVHKHRDDMRTLPSPLAEPSVALDKPCYEVLVDHDDDEHSAPFWRAHYHKNSLEVIERPHQRDVIVITLRGPDIEKRKLVQALIWKDFDTIRDLFDPAVGFDWALRRGNG